MSGNLSLTLDLKDGLLSFLLEVLQLEIFTFRVMNQWAFTFVCDIVSFLHMARQPDHPQIPQQTMLCLPWASAEHVPLTSPIQISTHLPQLGGASLLLCALWYNQHGLDLLFPSLCYTAPNSRAQALFL